MKKLSLFLLAALLSISSMAQVRKVAIMETVDREKALTYGFKLMLRSYLAEAVTNTPGYEAYDRTNLQQIFDEQEFQRTGYVSDEDIKKIGEMTGVQFVLVAEASKLDDNNLFITAKILNVETARVEKTASTSSQTDIPSLQKGAQDLASRLLQDIKLTGSLQKNAVLYSLGLNNENEQYITYVSSNEYNIGGQIVDRKTYYEFIKFNRQNCPTAYQEYQKGRKMAISGWCLFGIGCAVTGVGCVSVEAMIIGPCLVCGAGIPLLSVGYYKKHHAYKKYNQYCAPKKTTAVTLNLQSSRNGLGIAMNF